MAVVLREAEIPDFGLPEAMPSIPPQTYAWRCRQALARAQGDWLVVYADREHNANLVFLTGYDPRFEEALLLLGPSDRRILVVGNEGQGYAPVAGLPDLEVVLAQSMSLMGQDRSRRPMLASVLREAGIARGDRISIASWKYLQAEEWDQPGTGYLAPHYLVTLLAHLAADPSALSDATAVLMHPEHGLRAVVDADQIAVHEWGTARASAALWRILAGLHAGETELAAAARMGYAGEVLTAHIMLASGDKRAPVIDLRSPSGRTIARGDGVTSAIGYWGGLSCRAGLVTEEDTGFLQAASTYFTGLVAWYETMEIGVEGGAVFEAVRRALAAGGLRSALNPGHLTGHDEWVHTPIRPGSTERIAAGMPFQVDIIPEPLPSGWALNCEDGVAIADATLRAALQARHPGVWARIERRRAFVRAALGVALKESILPLSSTPLCLAPFWLKPRHLLARA
jgi:hypothetical protein